MNRLWCLFFGHEWVMLWQASAKCKGRTFVVCGRCEKPGWVL